MRDFICLAVKTLMSLDKIFRNVTPFTNIILAVKVTNLCRTYKYFGMCKNAVSTVYGFHLTVFPCTSSKSGPNISSSLDTSWTVIWNLLKVLCITIYLKLQYTGFPITACTYLARVDISIFFLVNPSNLFLTFCNMANPVWFSWISRYVIRLHSLVYFLKKISVPSAACTDHSLIVSYITR